MLMRTVFMGTPDFAVPALRNLHDGGHEIAAVVTQPDRPRARGNVILPSPVKEYALGLGVPIFQPERVSDPEFVEILRGVAPDAIVVVAFGQKIPPEILKLPRYGCINIHASLLPEYRGAAPIQRAIIDGKEFTGVTIMYMDEGWDTGDILIQERVEIGRGTTAGELHDRLSEIGAELLVKALRMLEDGSAPRIPQDHGKATYAPKIEKDDCRIDWSKSGESLINLVRGCSPSPGAFTMLNGKLMKIFSLEPVREDEAERLQGWRELEPGFVVKVDDRCGIIVRCGDGLVRIEEMQPGGGRRMNSCEFIRGCRMEAGCRFNF